MAGLLQFFKDNKDAISSIGTIVTAIVAIWGIYTAIETIRQYYQDRRDKLLSEAITLFTQNNNIQQLSALQMLCAQCRYSYEPIYAPAQAMWRSETR